jgi:hypothetical protein
LRVESFVPLGFTTFGRVLGDFICPEDVSGPKALLHGNVLVGVPNILQININKVRLVEWSEAIFNQHIQFQQIHWLYNVAHAFDKVDIVVYDGRVTELPQHPLLQLSFDKAIRNLVRAARPNVDSTLEVLLEEAWKTTWRLKFTQVGMRQ